MHFHQFCIIFLQKTPIHCISLHLSSIMSTIDKKKASSSLKHLIKEHHDEETNDNNKEKTNTDEIHIEEVFRKEIES